MERSLYDAAAPNEPLTAALDAMVEATAKGANWKVRKKTLLDIISVIDLASSVDPEFADIEADDEEDAEAGNVEAVPAPEAAAEAEPEELDELDQPADFIDTLPLYIGAVLERLGEKHIVCVEQAAFYLLSAHPEHQEAAAAWIEADYRHAREFRKFLKANRYYWEALTLLDPEPWVEDDAVD